MAHGHGAGRLTAEQRRRIEEEEERREAERVAELARQRALLQLSEDDAYVSRRVRSEMETLAELQRRELEEELAAAGGAGGTSPYLLLLIGGLLSLGLLALIYMMSRG